LVLVVTRFLKAFRRNLRYSFFRFFFFFSLHGALRLGLQEDRADARAASLTIRGGGLRTGVRCGSGGRSRLSGIADAVVAKRRNQGL
jgi:hypothetical protein